MRTQPFRTERLLSIAAAMELLLGLGTYAFPGILHGSLVKGVCPFAPHLAGALVASGVILLLMARYPLLPGHRRLLALAPGGTLGLMAYHTAMAGEWAGTVLHGFLAAGVLVSAWVPAGGSAGQRTRLDLAHLVLGAVYATVGIVMLAAPGLLSGQGAASGRGLFPLGGVLALAGAAALLLPPASGSRRVCRAYLRHTVAALFPLLLVYTLGRAQMWAGALTWAVWGIALVTGAGTGSLRPGAGGAPAMAAALEQPAVLNRWQRLLKTWFWVLALLLVAGNLYGWVTRALPTSLTMGTAAVEVLVLTAVAVLGIHSAAMGRNILEEAVSARSALRRQVERLQLMGEIGTAIRRSLDAEEILDTAVKALGRTLDTDRCFIRLRHDEALYPVAHEYTRAGEKSLGSGHIIPAPILGLVVKQRRVAAVADVATDPLLDDPDLGGRQGLLDLGVRAVMAAPIQVEGELLGVVGVHQRQPRRWAGGEVWFLQAVADQLGMALTHARAHGLLARRHGHLQVKCDRLEAALKSLRQSEEARNRIEAERARLTAILEATPDFVAIADPQGNVQYYNRAARRMLGIGDDEDLGQITVPDTHPAWAGALVMRRALPTAARDGMWQGETAFLSRDGREIPVSQVILAHKAPDGRVEYYSTIARDITERKEAEETQRNILHQLLLKQQQLATLNAFLIGEHEVVRQLTAVATAIAGGDLDRRAPDPGPGKLGDLARALNEMADGLKARIREREASRSRIVAAQEAIRRQVAEQLHSSVQSKLLTLWYQLGRCRDLVQTDQEQAVRMLDGVRAHLERLREDEVRNLSYRLHPTVVSMGLVPALSFLREQFEPAIPIELEIAPDLKPAGDGPSPCTVSAVLTVYRFVEEALTNVVKHARASKVVIRAWCDRDRWLTVTVEDDGSGFIPGPGQSRLGLSMLRDYIDAAGGTMAVDSIPGGGTRLTARLPASRGLDTSGKRPG